MEINNFLNTFLSVSGSLITSSSIKFSNINIVSSSYSQNNYETNIENSLLFINGVNIYSSSIISIANSESDVVVLVDIGRIGYELTSGDKIFLAGKFIQV